MLADNRHYVFYLWKNIMRREWVRNCLVPVYVVLGRSVLSRLLSARSSLWCAGLFLCTAMVLVPAHLVEPRYFVVPGMLWQLHMLGSSKKYDQLSTWITILVHVGMNGIVLWIFLKKTFQAPDGSIGRFMY